MKRNIVLNSEYSHLDEFINTIPDLLEHEGTIVQNRRNLIKAIEYDGLYLNIKRFRKPIFINRIVYTFFRKPKAYKAYHNAIEVIKKGFDTPIPIAYIIDKTKCLLSLSYFISTQKSNIREIREYYHTKIKGDEGFLVAFAQYTAKLHEANILHLDYSPGNILISEKNKEYDFFLVDINRMKFCNVDIKIGCENFMRLFEYDDTFAFLAREYALARKFDPNTCVNLMLKYKHKFERKKERKMKFKRLFKKNKL